MILILIIRLTLLKTEFLQTMNYQTLKVIKDQGLMFKSQDIEVLYLKDAIKKLMKIKERLLKQNKIINFKLEKVLKVKAKILRDQVLAQVPVQVINHPKITKRALKYLYLLYHNLHKNLGSL